MLVVTERAENTKHGGTRWVCRCDCGKVTIADGKALKSGNTKSCGCRGRKYRSTEHHRLYQVWLTMVGKCSNPKHKTYKYYGARGISVCSNWMSFDNFADWMFSHGYDESLPRGCQTIDRIDNDGDYEPDNCRIISIKEQQRNKRSNANVVYNGKSVCASEFAETLNANYELVRVLIANGYTADEVKCVVNMKREAI